MDPAAPEPKVDFTVNSDHVVDSENISKGHRGLDESLGWSAHTSDAKLISGLILVAMNAFTDGPVQPQSVDHHSWFCVQLQKLNDYFVSESSCTVDVDFNWPPVVTTRPLMSL